jgi:hypothetical protein
VIRRAAIMLGVPVGVAVLIAAPLGWFRGEYQWLCAAVAVALVVPAGLVTLVLADRLGKATVFGPILALAVGTAARVFVGFGGAVVVFFAARPTFGRDPLSYLAWLLGVYLMTLVVETALLAGPVGAKRASDAANG